MSDDRDETRIGKGKPGPGRPAGVPNKATGKIREMIAEALDKAGGVDYLVEQAKASPSAFLALVGKVLPLQVAGDEDNPLKTVHEIRIIGVEPDAS